MLNTTFCRVAAVHQEIALPLVMDQRLVTRIVIGCVADGVAGDIKIVAEKQPRLTRVRREIGHRDFLEIHVQIEIHGITAHQFQLQPRVARPDFGYQRLINVAEFFLPLRADLTELPVHPDAEPKRMSQRVVFAADLGKIDVANEIVAVECDQERAVANRNISGHECLIGLARN